ncbi:hypothetical protein [Streptomyces sp. NPDC006012]|uniref:NAD-dependent epimerase/dehydratase family protein n=1 Tax=Streptomyces sp. NPDC006012 TaxID=3364739 RepID=UPI00368B4D0E
MSHPRRSRTAQDLIEKAPEGFLRLVLDPEPDGPPTALRTALSAWSAADPAATHHLVLQDDALPGPDFFDRVQDAVRAAPGAAIAFFTSWNSRNGAAVRMAALRGARWAVAAQEYTPTVALVLPTPVALGFAEFARRHGDGWPDDVIMQRYLRARRVPSYLTVPNLVEHDDFPSVARNDHHGLRRAACHGTVPEGTDWDLRAGLSEADVIPFFKHGVAQCAVRRGADGPWTTVDSERFCGRLGFPLEWFRKQLTAAAMESAPTLDALAPVRPRALEALWVTAGLTGFLSRRAGTGLGPLDAPDTAGGLRGPAVATMGPGGLCGEIGALRLTALYDVLAELAAKAVELGALAHDEQTTVARLGQAGPAASKGRITVVGASRGLGRFIGQDLEHQGYDTVLLDPDTTAAVHDLAGADAVVHVGPLARGRSVAAAAERAGIGQVVSVSTEGAAAEGPAPAPVPGNAVLTVLHIGTPYGPGVVPDDSPLPDFVEKSLLRRPITLTEPLPEPVHYVHATDVCRAVEQALLLRRPGVFEICNDDHLSAPDLADAICAAVRPVPVDGPDGAAAGRPAPSYGRPPMTAERAAAELGWRPAVPFAEGLRSFAQWLAYEAEPPQP